MARTFNYSIDSISGGLSNKPELLKDYSEPRDMSNMMISQYKGLKRRNPTTAELDKLNIETIRTDPNYTRLLRVPNTNKDIVKVFKDGDKTLLFCIYDNRDIIDDLEPIPIGIDNLTSEGFTIYNTGGIVGDFDEAKKYYRFEPVIIDFESGEVLFTIRDKAITENLSNGTSREIKDYINNTALSENERFNYNIPDTDSFKKISKSSFINNMFNFGLENLNEFDYDISDKKCKDIFSLTKKGNDFYILNKYKNIKKELKGNVENNLIKYQKETSGGLPEYDVNLRKNSFFFYLPQKNVDYNKKYEIFIDLFLRKKLTAPDEIDVNGYKYYPTTIPDNETTTSIQFSPEYTTPAADFDDGVNVAADFTKNTYIMERIYNQIKDVIDNSAPVLSELIEVELRDATIILSFKKECFYLTKDDTFESNYTDSTFFIDRNNFNLLKFNNNYTVGDSFFPNLQQNLDNEFIICYSEAEINGQPEYSGIEDIASFPDNVAMDLTFYKVGNLKENETDDYYVFKKTDNTLIESFAEPEFKICYNEQDDVFEGFIGVLKNGYSLPITKMKYKGKNNKDNIYNEFNYLEKGNNFYVSYTDGTFTQQNQEFLYAGLDYFIEPLIIKDYTVGDYRTIKDLNDFLNKEKETHNINDFEFKNGSLILYYDREAAFSQNRNINNFSPISLRSFPQGSPLFLQYLSNSNNEFKKVIPFKNNSLIFCDNDEQVLLSFENNIISLQTLRFSDFNNFKVSEQIEPFTSNNSLIFIEKDDQGKDYIYEIYENYNGILKTRLLNRKIQGIDFNINKIFFYKNKLFLQNKDNLNEFLVNNYAFDNEDNKTYDLWEKYNFNSGFGNIINVDDSFYSIGYLSTSKFYLDELNNENDYIYYLDNYIDLGNYDYNVTIRKDFENFDETNTGNIPDYNTFTGNTRMYFKYTSDGSTADKVERYIKQNFTNNGYVIIENKRYKVLSQGNYERLGGEKGYYLVIDHLFDEIKNQNYQDTNVVSFPYNSIKLGSDFESYIELNDFYITDRYTKQKITYGNTKILELKTIFNNTNAFNVDITKTKRDREYTKKYKYTDTVNNFIDNETYDNFDNSSFNVKIKSDTEDYDCIIRNDECSAFCLNALSYKIKFNNKL